LILTTVVFAFQIQALATFKPTLNVLTSLHTLNYELISKFESENNVNIRVDFVGGREEFEPVLKAGLRTYDVVVADERILEKLYISRIIRTIPEDSKPTFPVNNALYKRSKMTEDGTGYLPLFVDPMGIAYNKQNSTIPNPVTWDVLIQTDENPYWRQRVYLPQSAKILFFLSLMATKKELNPQSWFIPETTTRWFKELSLQNANTDLPLEYAFLGDKTSAAVLFYSQYLRLQKVVNNIDFVVPQQNTFFDRISVGWCSNSAQEGLSKKLIKFLYSHSNNISQKAGMISLSATEFKQSPTKNWVLFEDDIPLPKKIENILKDLSQNYLNN
jgi:spermidine/putrescine-binding protein